MHVQAESAGVSAMVAVAAEAEVRRIEARYSRYRPDSELTRINLVAAVGGTTDIDAETAGLIAYAKACGREEGLIITAKAEETQKRRKHAKGR